ncbi:MAG: thiamine phosphate synthase [Nitrospirales bacterium]|nr:thiamine phosphate synthase [Nitrospirales bacterium]
MSRSSSNLSQRLYGLYLILDERWDSQRPLDAVLKIAATQGVRLFQYRNKAGSAQEVYEKALRLCQLAHDAHALFLLNDRCDIALAIDADGVHLGQEDLPLDLARKLMGQKIIGISTHAPHEVQGATEGGADYLGFGPVFSTATKRDHEPIVGLAGLTTVRALTSLPIFAIGGITEHSIEQVQLAGANGAAVASAVLDAFDLESAIRPFMTCVWPTS